MAVLAAIPSLNEGSLSSHSTHLEENAAHIVEAAEGPTTVYASSSFLILVMVSTIMIVCFGYSILDTPTVLHHANAAKQPSRKVVFLQKQEKSENCPIGWNQGPGAKCFMFVNVNSSWEDSESSCRSRSAHLAAVTSNAEIDFLQLLCSSSNDGCWVGGRQTSSRKWKWSDCEATWNGSNSFLATSDVNCSTSFCTKSSEHCTLALVSQQSLQQEICTVRHPFVCVLKKGDKCRQFANRKEYLIILISVSCVILVTTLVIVAWLLVYRRTKRKHRSRRLLSRMSSSEASASSSLVTIPSLRIFTVGELRAASNNFGEENRIWSSGIGSTFRGILPEGVTVAVKKLERPSFQSREVFLSEMKRIARLRHPNVVGVIGCCYEQGERYIVYEYIVNGQLDQWLLHDHDHDNDHGHATRPNTTSLDWKTRMRIAITAAQGIAFLHDQVKPHVIHKDIRASNLLLDAEFNAHLLGVGLTNTVPWEAAYERGVVAGSHGYLAPEFVYRNELTTKSDVYSFGVTLLEIVSGRKPAVLVDMVTWQTIFEWATPLVQAQRFDEIVDGSMSLVPNASEIRKVVDLVYSCTQHVPSMRPRMSYVVHQLQQVDVEAVNEVGSTSGAGSGGGEVVALVAAADEPAQIAVQSEIIETVF